MTTLNFLKILENKTFDFVTNFKYFSKNFRFYNKFQKNSNFQKNVLKKLIIKMQKQKILS